MENLNEIGLTELNETAMEEITGGIGLGLEIDISDVTGLLDSLLGSVSGIGGGVLG